MAHNQHNRSRGNGGFFLILLGALVFITAPIYLQDDPALGMTAIALGFAAGGAGFYIRFVRGRRGGGR